MTNQPRVITKPGSWTFQWDEPVQLSMRIDRIKQRSDGNISAEIRVTSGQDPLSRNGHLHHSHMSNLLGPRVRQDVVRALKKWDESIDWDAYIEVACEYVLQRFREGEPAVRLMDVEIPRASTWRIAPFLRERQPTVLFGRGGTMKSLISADLALRVAIGRDAMPGNVLILDWESTQEEWITRCTMLAAGMGIDMPANIYYRSCALPLVDDLEAIRSWVGEAETDMVIIDSAGYACGEEPEKAGPATAFFRALRALQTTPLIIAHQNSDSKTQKPFGSVYFENGARSTIQVMTAAESHNMKAVGLYNRKINFGQRFTPFTLRAAWHVFSDDRYTDGDSIQLGREDGTPIVDTGADDTAEDRIVAALSQVSPRSPSQLPPTSQTVSGLRRKDLVVATGLKESTVSTTLSRLMQKGKIANDGVGYYLPHDSET